MKEHSRSTAKKITGNRHTICYLCGKPLDGRLSRDHVPPRQFFADEVRCKHNPNLLTVSVHASCNLSYQSDEDYFVYSLMPFARGSFSGDAVRRKILNDCKHSEQQTLLRRILNEFERNPSGLVLPRGLVAKRFQGERILRIAWKIVRGLYFSHHGIYLPEDSPRGCEIVLPGQEPPLPFLFLPDEPIYGRYPAVFDYRFANYPDVHNLNYWAMLLWDRLILIVKFQFPACGCEACLCAALNSNTNPLS